MITEKNLELPDCGDNSCFYNQFRGKKRKGLRTNGGCSCKPHQHKRVIFILMKTLKDCES